MCEHKLNDSFLHIFELIHSSLRVALPDLPQCLVLVATLPDILFVNPVHCCLSSLISGVCQILLQRLELVLESFIAFSQCETIVDRILDVILK